MDAMLFAAGLGTRLRPLTDRVPKALVEVDGVPVLEHVARRLIDAGADRLVVNVHHLGEQVARFLEERGGFGVEWAVSREPGEAPLETGGGLLHARRLLRGDAPLFLHNADILTDLPLGDLYRAHRLADDPLATLAVMERPSRRRLLFDDGGLLGRVDDGKDLRLEVREPVGPVRELAFCGVHVVSARFPGLIEERGAFSILEPYLRLAAEGERILPFRVDGAEWIDIGRPEQLEEARRRFGAPRV